MEKKSLAAVLAVASVLLWYGLGAYQARFFVAQAAAGRPHVVSPVIRRRVETPVRLKIPRLSVNTAIVKVALAKDGSMDVPKRPFDAAWYKLGPRPGETGSAVIAGHVNWHYGAKSVFKNLHKLEPGDTIDVQDEMGATVTFVVRQARIYDATSDATGIFGSYDGKAHLNLVTCLGTWNARTKQYSKRLVVFADKKE